jgi:hypothetical protein
MQKIKRCVEKKRNTYRGMRRGGRQACRGQGPCIPKDRTANGKYEEGCRESNGTTPDRTAGDVAGGHVEECECRGEE